MERKEKIDAIYEKIANKERSFGCKYIAKHSKEGSELFETRDVEDHFLSFEDGDYCYVDYLCDDYIMYSLVKVIGHPVMIGDVLDYISKIKFDIKKTSYKLGLSFDDRDTDESKLFLIQEHYYSTLPIRWLNLRKPIEYQSDECINYVYSLIQKD